MHSALHRRSLKLDRAKLSRRSMAFALALFVHILVLILLLRQAPPLPFRVEERTPVTFALLPEAHKEAVHASAAAKTRHETRQAAQKPPTPVPVPPTIQPPPSP